jgi:uncharacterized membrane protein
MNAPKVFVLKYRQRNVGYVKKEDNERFPLSYFTLMITLMIIVAALLWIMYSLVPHVLYLPLGFIILVAVGLFAYYIISKKIRI